MRIPRRLVGNHLPSSLRQRATTANTNACFQNEPWCRQSWPPALGNALVQHASNVATANLSSFRDTPPVVRSSDTIYALSTAAGRAAVAVIRISGPACLDVYRGLCPGRPVPISRSATLRRLLDPRTAKPNRRMLDSAALVLYFPAPNTVTGEDVLELHVHGGPAIVKAVLEAIPFCPGAFGQHHTPPQTSIRYAEPGEFTKRGFYNDRLDLTQAESLGDSLAAETEQQRRLAVNGIGSSLATRYDAWRKQLLYARGELEALIDFSEDQHFDESPHEFLASISVQVRSLQSQLRLHIQNASRGELLRNGINIALLGAPNAGKSSLLNRIVGREAAIVSAEAGTTRDIVDVGVDIGGWFCRLGDMAGLRNKHSGLPIGGSAHIGAIEKEGMKRARARALGSDVVLVVVSVETSSDSSDSSSSQPRLHIDPEVVNAVRDCEEAGKALVVIVNKCDKIGSGLAGRKQQLHPFLAHQDDILKEVQAAFPRVPPNHIFTISCKDASSSSSSSISNLTTLSPPPPSTHTHPNPITDPDPDPGKIQTLLQGLTSLFQNLTTAIPATAGRQGPGGGGDDPSSSYYWEQSLSVSHRQSSHLQKCLGHLDDFLILQSSSSPAARSLIITTDQQQQQQQAPIHAKNTDTEIDLVVAAEHLRYAADCLAKITGRGEAGGDVEDVLGVVFEK